MGPFSPDCLIFPLKRLNRLRFIAWNPPPPRHGVLGREDEDDPLGGTRKRVQEKQQKVDARPIKRSRKTPEPDQNTLLTVEPSTAQKPKDKHKPKVDVNHGSLLRFVSRSIKRKSELGEQDSEASSSIIIGSINRETEGPSERETAQQKVINIGARIHKSHWDKLPDS